MAFAQWLSNVLLRQGSANVRMAQRPAPVNVHSWSRQDIVVACHTRASNLLMGNCGTYRGRLPSMWPQYENRM